MATIKKAQAGGVTKAVGKAPDKKGPFITVQKRNLPPAKNGKCLKCGGKAKKRR